MSALTFNKQVIPIVACLMPEFGIGFQGKLPWRLKKEMEYFKNVTSMTSDKNKKNAVLMGRKTWLSIPKKFRPLGDRLNVVLSRSNPAWELSSDFDNVVKSNNIEEALQRLDQDDAIERIYIIGGGEIYNSSFKYSTNILITEINSDKALEMDTFLNKSDINTMFKKASEEEWESFIGFTGYTKKDRRVEENQYIYEYNLYKKV